MDASQSIDSIAEAVSLSRNACWRRIKQMEEAGIIKSRVALLDAGKLGLGLPVIVLVHAADHSPDWLEKFHRAVRILPEIIGAYRMSGELDYVLRVQVADVADYDRFYKRLIELVPLRDISASFVMENIKDTTALPL
ncbi:MAG: Lrp/AsnC family transcriptional regulator [Litoreibacter sp.]|nr:Lrp/AsnC family transcriptional regulator [Litoreibacter sp.]